MFVRQKALARQHLEIAGLQPREKERKDKGGVAGGGAGLMVHFRTAGRVNHGGSTWHIHQGDPPGASSASKLWCARHSALLPWEHSNAPMSSPARLCQEVGPRTKTAHLGRGHPKGSDEGLGTLTVAR